MLQLSKVLLQFSVYIRHDTKAHDSTLPLIVCQPMSLGTYQSIHQESHITYQYLNFDNRYFLACPWKMYIKCQQILESFLSLNFMSISIKLHFMSIVVNLLAIWFNWDKQEINKAHLCVIMRVFLRLDHQEFGSQHPYNGSPPSVTTVPQPLWSLPHMVHRYICRQITNTHLKNEGNIRRSVEHIAQYIKCIFRLAVGAHGKSLKEHTTNKWLRRGHREFSGLNCIFLSGFSFMR